MKHKLFIFLAFAVIIGFVSYGEKLYTTILSQPVVKALVAGDVSRDKLTETTSTKNAFLAFISSASTEGNYVAITSKFLIDPVTRDSSYSINAYAKILESGLPSDVGNIIIGSDTLTADSSNFYTHSYPLAQGKALHGDTIEVDVSEPNARSLRRSVIVIPKEFYPSSMSLPKMTVDRTNSYVLNWQADPNNQYGLVQIEVKYEKGISQHYNSGMPNSVGDLVYQVTDNGSYSIPSSDLSRFPKDSYVSISISRAWKNSQSGNIAYIAVAQANTPPLLVIECPANLTIDGPSSLCTSASNYSITNLPTGSSVTWSVSPSSTVSLSCSTCSTTTLTPVLSGKVILTAVVSTICGPVTLTKNITVGAPAANTLYATFTTDGNTSMLQDWNCLLNYDFPGMYNGQVELDDLVATSYTWTLISKYPSSATTTIGPSSTPQHVTVMVKPLSATATYRLTTANACGSYSHDYNFAAGGPCGNVELVEGGGGDSKKLRIAPNPATSTLTASLDTKDKARVIKEIIVKNKLGNVVRAFKFKANNKSELINIQDLPVDIYIVQVFDGENWLTQKIMKK